MRARKWLRANFCEPFDLPQVAAHLGCSARMLQLSYKAVFGRTIRDDIVEMRLERAKKLLVDTDIPILRIPEHCGSDAPNHFMQFFKDECYLNAFIQELRDNNINYDVLYQEQNKYPRMIDMWSNK